jgi:hypothetical protein
MFWKSLREQLKLGRPFYLTVFAGALVLALISRAAFSYLEANRALSYVYATSGHGTMLEQICEVLTGVSTVALMALGGIVGAMVATLFCLVCWQFIRAHLPSAQPTPAPSAQPTPAPTTQPTPAPSAQAASRPLTHLLAASLWMLVALVVGVAVALCVFLGTLSGVQLQSIASKFGGGNSGPALMLVLGLTMFWSLLVLGCSMVLLVTASTLRRERFGPVRTALLFLGLTLVVGLILAWLASNIFMRFDVVQVDYAVLNGWLAAAVLANLAMALATLACTVRMHRVAAVAAPRAAQRQTQPHVSLKGGEGNA